MAVLGSSAIRLSAPSQCWPSGLTPSVVVILTAVCQAEQSRVKGVRPITWARGSAIHESEGGR